MAAGLTAEDAQLAGRLEQRRMRDPGLYPGMSRELRKQAMRQVANQRAQPALIAAWDGDRSAAGERIGGGRPAGARLGGRQDRGAPDHGQKQKPLHLKLRGRPVIHLDATLRPELARTILPGLEVTEIDAEAPHMHLRLVTGSFGKGSLCDEPARRSGRSGSGARTGAAECVDYVRWHARRFEPARWSSPTRIARPTFAGIPGVEVAHFNAIAGLDVYRDVGLLIVIGRPLPRERTSRRLSAAFFGHVPEGGYRLVQRASQCAPVRSAASRVDARTTIAPGRGPARGDLRRRGDPGDRPRTRGEPHGREPAGGACARRRGAAARARSAVLLGDRDAGHRCSRCCSRAIAVDSPADAAAAAPAALLGNEAAKKPFRARRI